MKIDNKLILEYSKSLNILYVEDDESLRNSTLELFLNFFKSVDTAVDGQEGYEKYQAFFNQTQNYYDIVFSDINMPNVDGIEMCEKIKENNFEQVLVFITAFNEPSYLNKAINLGANGFLTKPIEINQLKKILYITTQTVSDRKLVHTHYKQIEDRNMLTINLQDASRFDSSKDILLDLEKNKTLISHKWVDIKLVQERLSIHQIDKEYFRSHYGIKVIEYFLNVIKGEAEVGNCPIVLIMIEFFKNKDLPLEDIFMICVHFKNTITAYVCDNYIFNKKLFDDFSLILDKNFEGVIINYLKMTTEKKNEIQKAVSIKKEPLIESEDINYIEYVLENDVYELQDLEEEIDSLAISVTMSQSSNVADYSRLGINIKRYGQILSNYPLFSELGACIIKLGINFSDNAQLLFDDKQRMSNITALIEGFVNDLIIWRKEIFDNNIKDYQFLNSSFFSNVETIIMFIKYDESQESSDDGDMEFF